MDLVSMERDELEKIIVFRVEKGARERQRDEEKVGNLLSHHGLEVYRRIEGERSLGDISTEVLVPWSEIGAVLAKMQKLGIVDAKAQDGKRFDLSDAFFVGSHPEEGKESTEAELEEIEETKRRVRDLWGEKGGRLYAAIGGQGVDLAGAGKAAGISEQEAKKIILEMEKEGILKVEVLMPTRHSRQSARYSKNLPKSMVSFAHLCDGPATIVVAGEALLRFGFAGASVLSELRKGADVPTIAVESGLSLKRAREIVNFFERRKVAREERIGEKKAGELFGERGAKLCGKYGAEGLMIYLLYRKGRTATQIARGSGVEPKRALEIMAYINGLYGAKVDRGKFAEYEKYGIELEAGGIRNSQK